MKLDETHNQGRFLMNKLMVQITVLFMLFVLTVFAGDVSKNLTSDIVGKWEIEPNKRTATGTIVFNDNGTYEINEKLTDGAGVGTKGEYKLYCESTPVRIDLCLDKCGKPGSEWTTRFGVVRLLDGGQMEIHTSPDGKYPSGFPDDTSDKYTMILTKVKK